MADSTYWVYILTSKPYGTLYAGVTAAAPRSHPPACRLG